MGDPTPREIVSQLDKYIVGQESAKKAVAVAIRNRLRRQRVTGDLQEDIVPKNILMIGPTGVGKTEICRRLAKLVNAPFIKVEASKFTEVGYVGRDVDSMVRDLLESSVRMVRQERFLEVQEKATGLADERLVQILAPLPEKKRRLGNPFEALFNPSQSSHIPEDEDGDFQERLERAHAKRVSLRERLSQRLMEDEEIEIEIEDSKPPMLEFFDGANMQEMGVNLQDILGGVLPKKTKKRRTKVAEARRLLSQEEAAKLVDQDAMVQEAIRRTEKLGIVFLDELDKVAGRERASGPDVSREGVQRDLLPIIEGTTVVTKYGPVNTDHILFIAAGAFHVSKPSDLIPEIQGRFPIRVELEPLSREDFAKILKEPKNSLTKQYEALLETDGVELEFTEEGVDEIARMAYAVNQEGEDIGARRLHTVIEKLLEDILFLAPEVSQQHVVIDKEYVARKLGELVTDRDISRYIL